MHLSWNRPVPRGKGSNRWRGVKNSDLFRRNNAHLHHIVWNRSDFLWNQFKWRKDLVKGKIFCCKMLYTLLFCKHHYTTLGMLMLNHMSLSKEILAQIYYSVQISSEGSDSAFWMKGLGENNRYFAKIQKWYKWSLTTIIYKILFYMNLRDIKHQGFRISS